MPKLDLSNVEKLIALLTSYADALTALRQGVALNDAEKLANVTPALTARAMRQAADTLGQQAAEVLRLSKEVEALRASSAQLRADSKRKGRDLLREEADAALPAFTNGWEPLRDIAERMGDKSAAWLASRARDLQRRGLVESKWCGAERTASFKLWRVKDLVQPLGRECEFCEGPLHYGACEELSAARQNAIQEGRGRPVPITRAGP